MVRVYHVDSATHEQLQSEVTHGAENLVASVGAAAASTGSPVTGRTWEQLYPLDVRRASLTTNTPLEAMSDMDYLHWCRQLVGVGYEWQQVDEREGFHYRGRRPLL